MSSEIPPMSCPTTIGRGEDPCAHNDAYIHFAAKFRKEFGAVCDCCAACRAPGERGAGVRRRTADGGTYAYRTQTSVTSQTEHFALTAVGPRAYKSSRYDWRHVRWRHVGWRHVRFAQPVTSITWSVTIYQLVLRLFQRIANVPVVKGNNKQLYKRTTCVHSCHRKRMISNRKRKISHRERTRTWGESRTRNRGCLLIPSQRASPIIILNPRPKKRLCPWHWMFVRRNNDICVGCRGVLDHTPSRGLGGSSDPWDPPGCAPGHRLYRQTNPQWHIACHIGTINFARQHDENLSRVNGGIKWTNAGHSRYQVAVDDVVWIRTRDAAARHVFEAAMINDVITRLRTPWCIYLDDKVMFDCANRWRPRGLCV